jgi:hypothetical protein
MYTKTVHILIPGRCASAEEPKVEPPPTIRYTTHPLYSGI